MRSIPSTDPCHDTRWNTVTSLHEDGRRIESTMRHSHRMGGLDRLCDVLNDSDPNRLVQGCAGLGHIGQGDTCLLRRNGHDITGIAHECADGPGDLRNLSQALLELGEGPIGAQCALLDL